MAASAGDSMRPLSRRWSGMENMPPNFLNDPKEIKKELKVLSKEINGCQDIDRLRELKSTVTALSLQLKSQKPLSKLAKVAEKLGHEADKVIGQQLCIPMNELTKHLLSDELAPMARIEKQLDLDYNGRGSYFVNGEPVRSSKDEVMSTLISLLKLEGVDDPTDLAKQMMFVGTQDSLNELSISLQTKSGLGVLQKTAEVHFTVRHGQIQVVTTTKAELTDTKVKGGKRYPIALRASADFVRDAKLVERPAVDSAVYISKKKPPPGLS